jgi:general stress protein 26
MPESVKHDAFKAKEDPSVAKQFDTSSPPETKFEDFYKIVDGSKIVLLGTYRQGTGPVSRSMAIARRDGPDFLFLANANSQKFADLDANKEVNLTFSDSSMSWYSVTGEATTVDNSDPRIKEVWNRGAAAWFGDVGDGKHDGSAEDPRMALIEIKSKYITYYKAEAGALGYLKEIAAANITGQVAKTGTLREMKGGELDTERSRSK